MERLVELASLYALRSFQKWWLRRTYERCPAFSHYDAVSSTPFVERFEDLALLYGMTKPVSAGRIVALLMYCKKTAVPFETLKRLLIGDPAFDRLFLGCLAATALGVDA